MRTGWKKTIKLLSVLLVTGLICALLYVVIVLMGGRKPIAPRLQGMQESLQACTVEDAAALSVAMRCDMPVLSRLSPVQAQVYEDRFLGERVWRATVTCADGFTLEAVRPASAVGMLTRQDLPLQTDARQLSVLQLPAVLCAGSNGCSLTFSDENAAWLVWRADGDVQKLLSLTDE